MDAPRPPPSSFPKPLRLRPLLGPGDCGPGMKLTLGVGLAGEMESIAVVWNAYVSAVDGVYAVVGDGLEWSACLASPL